MDSDQDCIQVLACIKKYRDLSNRRTVIDMTPVEIMNAVYDSKGEYWAVTKKILNGNAIVLLHLDHLRSVTDLIIEIDNLIPGDSSVNRLHSHLQGYRSCEYIKRLMLWTESLKTEITLNEAQDEYENVFILSDAFFDVIDNEFKEIETKL